jgi:uncharacterized RDD family membrane protein YckC
VICPKCGIDVTGGVPSCPSCGEMIPDPSSNTGHTPAARFAIVRVVYAGFWLRAVAYVIDSVLLVPVLIAVIWAILQSNHVGPSPHDILAFYNSGSRQSTALGFLLDLVSWLYFAAFESSAWQATPGKKLLRLAVTDLAGQRISFLRATGRHFAKFFSAVTLFVGFAMIGFTQKKQGLHDIIAGCLVVRKIQ